MSSIRSIDSNSCSISIVLALLATVSAINVAKSAEIEALGGASFKYQGQLKEGGRPADGRVDLLFSLWDAAMGGVQIGSTVSRSNTLVVDGLFEVELDFSGASFDGSERWLAIQLRSPAWDGGGREPNFTALEPRQRVAATPYAVFALNGAGGPSHWRTDNTHIHNTNAGHVGIGDTTPTATLTVGDGDKFLVKGAEGDVVFTDDRASISFPAADAQNAPMIHMFSLGTSNAPRMVLAHSPQFADWGLRYDDLSDSFEYLSGGAPMMGIDLNGDEVTSSGGGLLTLGSTDGLNLAFDRDEIAARNNGTASDLLLNADGGRVGVRISAPEVPLHVGGGSDASLGGGGVVTIGPTTGPNMVIDQNEIMARDNGATSTLHLNANGGAVVVGGVLDIGLEMVEVEADDDSIYVACPAGKLPLGGGCNAGVLGQGVEDSSPGAAGWYCNFYEVSPVNRAYVICARVR